MTQEVERPAMRAGARRAIDFMGLYFFSSVWASMFLFASLRGTIWLMAVAAAGLIATFVGVGLRMWRRPGAVRGDDDPRARVVQILSLTGAITLMVVGTGLIHGARPFRFNPLPAAAETAGIGAIIAATILLFVGLLIAPSSATELTRRIHLEASTTTLGFVFVGGYLYPSVAESLGLPSLDTRAMSGVILVVYLLARVLVGLRYGRGGAR